MKKTIFTALFTLLALSSNVFSNICDTTYKDIVPLVQKVGFEITSTTKGRHNKGSKHYIGKAVDIRTRNRTDEEIKSLITYLESKGYIVIDERIRPAGRVWSGPHLHVHVPDCFVPEPQLFVTPEFKNPIK